MEQSGNSQSVKTATADDFDFWIEAGNTEKSYWRDIWHYRELLFILAWRDISIRYKQTIVGSAWAFVQPFLSMVIMTLVFGKLANLSTVGTAPYAILVFAAMLPWLFFANALSSSSQSIVSNANMISKVYFPRVIIPISSIFVSVADFLISFVILVGLMVWYQFLPSWQLMTLPIFIIFGILAAMGPGLLLTALTVRYRDFRILIPFIVQFGMFASPVGYTTQLIRDKSEWLYLLYSLNPLVGVIEGFRWAILGDNPIFFGIGTLISFGVGILLLLVGITYFRKTERSFADII